MRMHDLIIRWCSSADEFLCKTVDDTRDSIISQIFQGHVVFTIMSNDKELRVH